MDRKPARQLRHVPVLKTRTERRTRLLTGRSHHEPEILRDAALPADRLDDLALVRAILAAAQALGFVDAAAVRVQRPAPRRRVVAGGTARVSEPDHGGERERRRDVR